jgi:hypothetical protein
MVDQYDQYFGVMRLYSQYDKEQSGLRRYDLSLFNWGLTDQEIARDIAVYCRSVGLKWRKLR